MMLSFTWLTMLTLVGSMMYIAVDSKPHAERKKEAMEFFQKYGYIDSFTSDLDNATLTKKVKNLQRYANLPISGELNDATLDQMTKDRCGMQDPEVHNSGHRAKRYLLQGTKWSKKHVTWYLHNAPTELTREQVRTELYRSFNLWSAASTLTFEELSTAIGADIEIKFVRYSHGDPYSFDGPGRTLAHGFYPLNEQGLAGDVHFDDSETFSIGSANPRTKDLTWVAVHEIGHALGLEHSQERDALMFAWYQGYTSNFKLKADDIRGIQALYGAPVKTAPPTTVPPPTTTTPTPPTATTTTPATTPTTAATTTIAATETIIKQPTTPDDLDLCPASVDVMFSLDNYRQYTFIVSGKTMYLIKKGKIARRDLSFSSYFGKIKGTVDAAFKGEDGKTVFFVGRSFYVYDSLTYVSGPESIAKLGLPSYVNNLSSAQMWIGNRRTYFYYRGRYWRRQLDKTTTKHTLTGPYSLIYAWQGVPQDITASGTLDGRSLFFKGDQFYDLDISKTKIYADYPRHISELFHCKPLNTNKK